MSKRVYDPLTAGGLPKTKWGLQQIREIFLGPGSKSKHFISAHVLDQNKSPIFRARTVDEHLRKLRKEISKGKEKVGLKGLCLVFFFIGVFVTFLFFCKTLRFSCI